MSNDEIVSQELSTFRTHPWEALPESLRRGLSLLSAQSKTPLALFGGYLRDAYLGLRARDLDILACGGIPDLKAFLGTAGALPFDILNLEETIAGGLIVSIRLQPEDSFYRLDFVNVERFLLAQQIEPSAFPEEWTAQVLPATDFSVNACALMVPTRSEETPQFALAGPAWRKDLSSGLVRHIRPPIPNREGLFLFKAVRLERLLSGSIAPETERVIRRVGASSPWRSLKSAGHHKHLLRMFKSKDLTPLHLERLWELGILTPIFPKLIPRLEVRRLCEHIFNSSAFPSMGEDGKAPWILAALLSLQPDAAQRRFRSELSRADREQLVTMQECLLRNPHFAGVPL
jgi:hypothetical protein